MNPRNVAALERMIWECIEQTRLSPAAGERAVRRDLAERLAARGVLVPGALTDEEATGVPFDGSWLSISDQDVADAATRHRAALERIAKGDGA